MRQKNFIRVSLMLGFTLAGLLIAEVTLRVLDVPRSYPLSGWKSPVENPAEKNEIGFRGQPIQYAKDDFVIVLLGDSSVEAAACSYETMPERRLQAHLNAGGRRVRVFSLGTGGYGQDQ